MTCAKTQGFLAKHKMAVTAQTDAKKATIKGDAALGVLKDVDEIYAAKGKQIIHVYLKLGKPPRAQLLEVLLGATGTPTLSLSEGEGAVPIPAPPEGEREMVRGT